MVVFIRENSRMAMIAAGWMGMPNAAMVIGNTVYLWGASRQEFLRDQQWVRHEVVHVLQYQKYGVLLFWWLYIADSVKKGYNDNRFEREARNFERDGKILDGVVFK